MKFIFIGGKDKPVIVLIHGMFCNSDSNKHFVKYLKDNYCIIMPTLDGHCGDETIYTTKEEQAKKILEYIKNQGIKDIELLQGSSMGAEVALEMINQSDIHIQNVFLDGGPFFKFPKLFRFIMYKKFVAMVKMVQKETDIKTVRNNIINNKFLKLLIGNDTNPYEDMFSEMYIVCNSMKLESIKNIIDTCYNCTLPEFHSDISNRITFFFGKEELAHISKRRLMKKYPNSIFRDMEGFKHLGYQTKQPMEYAKILKDIIT